MALTLIGDVHGLTGRYLEIVKKHERTLQLGDLGFQYSFLSELNSDFHKVLAGNHDNYSLVDQYPHFLGDYGVEEIPEFGKIFFLRGAFSIDYIHRLIGRDWWPEEELTYLEAKKAIALYEQEKPDFVVTHTCPGSINKHFLPQRGQNAIGFRTEFVLDTMFEIHQPKAWVFGHFHYNHFVQERGTIFRCLDELSTVTLQDTNDLQKLKEI